jgi:thiamine-phosphate diphosphorylase
VDARGEDLRERLGRARVALLFTPELCGARDPLTCLEAALPWVDLVQVRPKPLGVATPAPAPARACLDWTRTVLALVAGRADAPLVLVDDRVDVARALAEEGCAGVHLGQDDCPPELARAHLGSRALVGLSTHDAAQLVRAHDEPVDLLGFGPVHATGTKGYARGLSAEVAWIASRAAALPLFAIGGIDRTNVADLHDVGRVAVGSGILSAEDPGRAARELRALLLD